MIFKKKLCIAAMAFCIAQANAQNSAPSSHLNFNFSTSARGDILINEVRVPSSGLTMNTYYEVLGWWGTCNGYGGNQKHQNGPNFIFSIWDEANRPLTTMVDVDHGTKTQAFGGEGTGLQSLNFVLGWKPDVWYTCAVRCWPSGTHTYYGYFVRDNQTGVWRHLVTMDVSAANGTMTSGNDGFLEDWSNTGANGRETNMRKAWYHAGTKWYPAGSAYYSVNSNDLASGGRSYNFRNNWDGGVKTDSTGKYYYMIAGGSVTPTCANGVTFTIPRTGETAPAYPALKFASLTATVSGSSLIAKWVRDSTTLPQLTYTLEVFNDTTCTGAALATVTKTAPRRGVDTLNIAALTPNTRSYALRIKATDIFTNTATPAITMFGSGSALHQGAIIADRGVFGVRGLAKGVIALTVPRCGTYKLTMIRPDGSVVLSDHFALVAGNNRITALNGRSAGTYVLRISGAGQQMSRVVVME